MRRLILPILATVVIAAPCAAQCDPRISNDFEGGEIVRPPVRAFAVYDDDGPGPHEPALYIGGGFTSASGLTVKGVARWTGRAWETLGAGPDPGGVVNALAVFDPDGPGPQRPLLIAAGIFRDSSNVLASHIAAWDGQQWTQLGTGIGGASSVTVTCLAVFDEDGAGPNPPRLFAAGTFTSAGGVPVNSIARWDGAAWTAVDTGLRTSTGTPGSATAMTIFDIDGAGPGGPALVVGGNFSTAGGVTSTNLAAWNGTSWTTIGPTVFGASVGCVGVYDPDDSGPLPPSLIVGGLFTSAAGVSANRIIRWDGASWSALGAGLAGGVAASPGSLSVFDPDGAGGQPPVLYVGGDFTSAGGINAVGIARWDGAAWSALAPGLDVGITLTTSNYRVRSMLQVPASAATGTSPLLAVGGEFITAGGMGDKGFALWDGAAWKPTIHSISGWTGTANDNSPTANFMEVFDPDGDGPIDPMLVIHGAFRAGGDQTGTSVVGWRSSGWINLGGAAISGPFTTFDADGPGPAPRLLIASGAIDNGSGKSVCAWNGASWSALGSGFPSLCTGVCTTTSGNVQTLYAACGTVYRWTGAAWTAVVGATGPNPASITALTALDLDGPGPQAARVVAISSNGPALWIWDGVNWMQTIVGGNAINTVTVYDPDGPGPLAPRLVVGGVGSGNFDSVREWNGAAWVALGHNLDAQQVHSLCVFDDGGVPGAPALYAGAYFSNPPGLYRWNGSVWTLAAEAVAYPNSSSVIPAMCVFDDDGAGPHPPSLLLGGNFLRMGGMSACGLARYGRDATPAWISTQPAPAGVFEGSPASFSAAAGGTPPLTYQWRRAGAPLTEGAPYWGTHSATLTIDPAARSLAGSFDVIVTNSCGSTISAAAALGVRCLADVDDGSGAGVPDGGVTIDDLIYYLTIFSLGDAGADVDDGSGTGTPDGGLTIDDLLYYLQRFVIGC